MDERYVCFYISDHGFGHASRCIAIIRGLLNKTNLNMIVKTSKPLNFIKSSLKSYNDRVIYDYIKNDVGLILEQNSLYLDRNLMKWEIQEWTRKWDNYIEREIEYLSGLNVNLIISDITPQAFLIADKMNIKSIGVCNFTWYDIYRNIYDNEWFLEKIKGAYYYCDRFICYPFSINSDIISREKREDIGLISRSIYYKKVESIKKAINYKRNRPIIYIGIGKSVEFEYLNRLNIWGNSEYTFLTSSGSMPKNNNDNIFKIPTDETETQNYIAACDLVITKAGWSTIAETIIAKIPLIVIKRDEIIEDYNTARLILKNSIGLTVEPEEINTSLLDNIFIKIDILKGFYDDVDDKLNNNIDIVVYKILSFIDS